jgi:hypothetical protein
MGGGSAAITGGDPLKGALLGGLTGGAGAGISGGLAGAAGTAGTLGTEVATQAATQAGTQLGTEAATNLATSAANPGITTLANGLPADISSQIVGQVAPNASAPVAEIAAKGSLNPATGQFTNTTLPLQGSPATNMANLYPPGFANPNTATLLTPSGTSYAIPSAGSNVIPSTAAPQTFGEGMAKFAKDPMASLQANKFTAAASGLAGAIGGREEMESPGEYDGPLKRFKFNPESYRPSFFAAEGGITDLAAGGYDRMVGEQPMYSSNMARGGISDLGSYSDYARGGRMLKGPGDGMSDSIPASIAGKRPARLATEEFVVPADVVSHLGNGSSDAGAKQLYAMMDRVRKARTGRKSQGREISPQQYMAA